MNLIKRVVIFALNDKTRLAKVKYPYKQVFGSYTMANGNIVQEDSYVVVVDEDDKLSDILDIAAVDGQESVLVLDEYRKASLIFCQTGDVNPIGQWTEVSSDEALQSNGYTFDKSTGQYYMVK